MTARRHFGLFAFLFGAAVVFHQSKLDDWDIPSLGLLVTLAAVWLMLDPTSLRRFYALLAVHLVSVLVALPLVVNHWLLVFFMEIGLFVALAYGALTGRAWARDPAALWTAFAPYLRLQVALVYLFAAIAKVNSDFLDPDVSCAVAMVDTLLEHAPLSLSASWQEQLAIWGTIALEAALPFLLVWRRTRLAAVYIGCGFHLTLALAGHLPFSGFAMAFYSLFAPDDTVTRFERVLQEHSQLRAVARRVAAFWTSPAGHVSALGATLAIAVIVESGGGRLVSRAFLALFCVYVLVLLALLTLCVLVDRAPVRQATGVLRLASPIWLIGPALVVLNALSPYAGLKTQSTFTMYSNLQTEGEQWNHEIVPKSVQVVDVQDDLVTILHSSDPAMQQAAERHRRWVWAGLRAWARRHPDASLTYEHRGRRYVAERVGDDPNLKTSLVVSKLAFFRDVPPTAGNDCRTHRGAASDQGS